MHTLRAERMKRSAMTIAVQQQATNADTAVTRTDLVRLLQEAGSPEQLDVTGQDLHGITLMNGNLRGANLSLAQVCEANLCGANLSRADLHGANLCGTYLCWADLRGANLHAADLREADLSWADLREADLRGADLSWASFGGASACEPTRSHLRRRGAIFREKTSVIVAERFSEKAGGYALGFALGLPFMSVVSLLCVLGIRVILTHMRLKRHPGDGTPRQVGSSPECRS